MCLMCEFKIRQDHKDLIDKISHDNYSGVTWFTGDYERIQCGKSHSTNEYNQKDDSCF